uniref:Tudor domain-containing protein n=1 Tax=Rhabditophanes sp. KR3021 TaxID=114890 RepID=A0AC35UH72_9BILA
MASPKHQIYLSFTGRCTYWNLLEVFESYGFIKDITMVKKNACIEMMTKEGLQNISQLFKGNKDYKVQLNGHVIQFSLNNECSLNLDAKLIFTPTYQRHKDLPRETMKVTSKIYVNKFDNAVTANNFSFWFSLLEDKIADQKYFQKQFELTHHCGALSSNKFVVIKREGEFVRAQVVRRIKDQKAEVFFIDKGFPTCVKTEFIRPLSVPCHSTFEAVLCTLDNITNKRGPFVDEFLRLVNLEDSVMGQSHPTFTLMGFDGYACKVKIEVEDSAGKMISVDKLLADKGLCDLIKPVELYVEEADEDVENTFSINGVVKQFSKCSIKSVVQKKHIYSPQELKHIAVVENALIKTIQQKVFGTHHSKKINSSK